MNWSKLKVVSHKYPPYAGGGLAPYVERNLYHLRLLRKDIGITLFTLNYPEDSPVESTEDRMRIVRPKMNPWLKQEFLNYESGFSVKAQIIFALVMLFFNLAVFRRLCCEDDKRSTLLCVHDWQSSPVGILAAALLRMPVVYHVHNTELSMTSWGRAQDKLGLIRFCERMVGKLAKKVIVPTPEMKELLTTNGWNASKVSVVPHGFENQHANCYLKKCAEKVPQDLSSLRDSIGLSEEDKVIVFVGRLSKAKGIRTLIRSLPSVLETHPCTKLVMLGVGFPGTDENAIVKGLVEDLDLNDHVHAYYQYLPSTEVTKHYLIADVCVFPSIYEPFGLVSVEAMSVGKPVILGRGFSDIISYDGRERTAYRMVEDSPSELSDLIIEVLSNPGDAAELASRGRGYVKRTFTWSNTNDRTLAVYESAATT